MRRKREYAARRGNTGPYPSYKQIILDQTMIYELEAYLDLALGNIAEHARSDLVRFTRKIEQQLDKQMFRVKKDFKPQDGGTK